MRKQTKIVAVASAAALLAIGASMTAFAAQGWVQEDDGVWYYYDKDGNRVEDEWKRSGDNWYWLSSEENGGMAVDTLVEDDSDTYYVDSNGVMVRNTWVKVVNEEQDEDDDPAEYHYYYMQSNGKAIKNTGDTTNFKTLDGKRYAFDENGVMLYGWVNKGIERVTDEDEWSDSDTVYYLGNWDDGAMKTGWQKIYVHDDAKDDELEYWFYFKSNGQKRMLSDADAKAKKDFSVYTINSRKYGFDSRGVMVYEWALSGSASNTSAANWRYFNNIEDGARVSKGWFKVVAPLDDNDNTFKDYGKGTFASTDASDETERWYWADGNGELAKGEIRRIKGKYYGFRPENDTNNKGAAMLSGLVLLETEGDQIVTVVDDGIDGDELTDIIEGNYTRWTDPDVTISGAVNDWDNVTLFYFGSSDDEDADGAMKTGSVTINVDGDNYQFQFSKAGGAEGKGRGVTGIDDGKYIYNKGVRIKADSDDKYVVVHADGDIGKKGNTVYKVTDELSDARTGATPLGHNRDDDTVYLAEFGGGGYTPANKDAGTAAKGTAWNKHYYLVSTSGSIVKDKTAAKDGNDWYFYVDEKNIKMYLSSKVLKVDNDTEDKIPVTLLDNWDKWVASADCPICPAENN